MESRESVKAALEIVRVSMHERFPGARARLEQLDGHLATVSMVVDHIHDEDEKGEPA